MPWWLFCRNSAKFVKAPVLQAIASCLTVFSCCDCDFKHKNSEMHCCLHAESFRSSAPVAWRGPQHGSANLIVVQPCLMSSRWLCSSVVCLSRVDSILVGFTLQGNDPRSIGNRLFRIDFSKEALKTVSRCVQCSFAMRARTAGRSGRRSKQRPTCGTKMVPWRWTRVPSE